MSAWRLAIALLRIPRLFATLLLIPLGMSLLLVYGQLIATVAIALWAKSSGETAAQQVQERKKSDIGRWLLLGNNSISEAPRICRWVPKNSEKPNGTEIPPSLQCAPDRLDVALQVDDPATFEAADYAKTFDGLVERIHICRSCTPDAVISAHAGETRADAHSIQALLLFGLARTNDQVQDKFIAAHREIDHIKALTGTLYLHSAGFRRPIDTEAFQRSMAVIVNIAALIMIALWLALKAHRKVLDYFARSGALLPLVAATGKQVFYRALWLLTFFRVGAFLIAAIPMSYYGFKEVVGETFLDGTLPQDPLEILLWVSALLSCLLLATLIASIADLQHRSSLLSILYKWVPLILCFGGTIIWSCTFLFDSAFLGAVRTMLTALPIIGMGPILVAPVLTPAIWTLALNAALTTSLFLFVLSRNTRWFAAHVEEL